jgi:hypothetical protein
MAEIKFVLTAEDKASPVIEKLYKNTLTAMPVAGIAAGAETALKGLLSILAGAVISHGIGKFWENFDRGALKSKENAESIKNSVSGIEQQLEKLTPPIEKFLSRFETAGEIKSRINEITSQLKGLNDYITKETYLPYRTMGTELRDSLTKELTNLQDKFKELNQPTAFQQQMSAFEKSLAGLDKLLNKTLVLNTKTAFDDLGKIKSQLDSIKSPIEKIFKIDNSGALKAISDAKSALDSIPNISTKTVIIEYKTQASPVRPFSEGMAYIKSQMESLPVETSHTVKYSSGPGTGTGASAGGITVNLSPTVNISGAPSDGAKIARDFQERLASDILTNRSPIMPAIKRRLGMG